MDFSIPLKVTKIAISGSREWPREATFAPKAFSKHVSSVIKLHAVKHETSLEVNIGDAPGVDAYAAKWLVGHGITVTVNGLTFAPRNAEELPAGVYYRQHIANGATPALQYVNRDRAMIDQCELWIGIWNGDSAGTRAAFEYARSKAPYYCLAKLQGKDITVVRTNYDTRRSK